MEDVARETTDYDKKNDDEKQKIIDKEWDKLEAVMYLLGSDDVKFKDLKTDLESRYTRLKEAYPANILAMHDVMESHRGSADSKKSNSNNNNTCDEKKDGKS